MGFGGPLPRRYREKLAFYSSDIQHGLWGIPGKLVWGFIASAYWRSPCPL